MESNLRWRFNRAIASCWPHIHLPAIYQTSDEAHPENGTEFFAAVVTAVDPASLTLAFPSVAGRSYDIDYSGNPNSWETIRSGIEGDGSEKSITVERDGENRRGFYRVSASR